MRSLVVYHEGYQGILPELCHVLRCEAVERDQLTAEHYTDKDIIVVIGGDGTFLRAGHLNPNVPMFGINASPNTKEGFFMQSTIDNYKEKLAKISKGFKTVKLLRLAVEINNTRLAQYALNDVYIGDAKPYNVSNYVLKIGSVEEFQRSSGIVVSTPSGSTSWLKSAGGTVMNRQSKKYQYMVRELYEGRLTKDYRMRKGILDAHQALEIIFKKPGIVVIDSISPEYWLKKEDIIKIYVGKPLPYIL